MSNPLISTDLLGEIIMLLVTKGIPAGIKLLSDLKEEDITAEKVRALRLGLKPPVKY